MADEQMPKPDEEKDGEGKESKEEKGGKEMDALSSMVMGKEMSKGGVGEAVGGGLVGLILGGLLSNNGGGLFGGGNNADRFAATDTLVQGVGNATQRQISDSTFALSSQACNNANALSTQIAQGFCGLEAGQQRILGAIAAVDARVALAEERITGNQKLLAVEAENAALKAKLADQQVNVSGNLDVSIASAVSRMIPQIANAVRAV